MRAVLVTGSRSLADYHPVWARLDELKPEIVIHGGCYVGTRPRRCMGTDYWAHRWCVFAEADESIFRARWSEGRRAGPLRNQRMCEMVAMRYPDAEVLAFPEKQSVGTRDCIRRARKLGLKVTVVEL